MILVAVVVGYLLGVIPFIVPKIVDMRKESKCIKEDTQEQKEQMEIFNEWLNGPKKVEEQNNKVNQADIFNEYMTGIESNKEE